MDIKFIFNGGLSKRFHTVDTIKEQNIAEHSFGVAWLCELLTGGAASKDLIMAALAHDLAEHVVGDIPANTKWALPSEVRRGLTLYEKEVLVNGMVAHYEERLTPEDEIILKYADIFDGMLFCLRERAMGNQHIEGVFHRWRIYCAALQTATGQPNEQFTSLFNCINNEWKELTDDNRE